MKLHFRPRILRLIALATLICLVAHAADAVTRSKAEVIVNIDMTADGRQIARPTPDQPTYYVPVILGYHTGGEIIAGEKPPSRAEVIRQLGKALAKEGYILQALRPNANSTRPALVLAIEWGYLNPEVTDFGDDPTFIPADSSQTAPRIAADFNQREMLTMVAGGSVYRGEAFTTSEWERLRDAAAEGRYYIVVSAYDFDASLKGERKLLWRARMSTERQGVWMDDVVPALVASGATIFGRDVKLPKFVTAPVREGKVEIGTPTVVDPLPDGTPKTPPARKP
jgi:hypothetical protein